MSTMRISESQLRRIIREELLREGAAMASSSALGGDFASEAPEKAKEILDRLQATLNNMNDKDFLKGQELYDKLRQGTRSEMISTLQALGIANFALKEGIISNLAKFIVGRKDPIQVSKEEHDAVMQQIMRQRSQLRYAARVG